MSSSGKNPRKKGRIIIAPTKGRIVAVMLFALALLASAAIAQVWTHQQAIAYGYKITKETRRRTRLMEQNRRLRIELAVLKDPARISKLAREHFGLADPEPEQVHRLRIKKKAKTQRRAALPGHGPQAPFDRRKPQQKRAGFGVTP